ncbi:Uncharacterized protein APZ42_008884, partial [Daphnia magna]
QLVFCLETIIDDDNKKGKGNNQTIPNPNPNQLRTNVHHFRLV